MTHRRRVATRIFFYSLVIIAVAVVVFPLIWMLGTAVKPNGQILDLRASLWPSQFEWSNIVKAWNAAPFGRWYLNSVIFAVSATTGTDLHSHDGRLRLRHVRLPRKTGPVLRPSLRLDDPLSPSSLCRWSRYWRRSIGSTLTRGSSSPILPLPWGRSCSASFSSVLRPSWAKRPGSTAPRSGASSTRSTPPWPAPLSPPWGSLPF